MLAIGQANMSRRERPERKPQALVKHDWLDVEAGFQIDVELAVSRRICPDWFGNRKRKLRIRLDRVRHRDGVFRLGLDRFWDRQFDIVQARNGNGDRAAVYSDWIIIYVNICQYRTPAAPGMNKGYAHFS